MRFLRPLVFAPLLLAACASSPRGRADDAFAKGEYSQAADLYQEAVEKDRRDEDAKAGLVSARVKQLTELVERADAAKGSGHIGEALGLIEATLRKRGAWNVSLEPEAQTKLDELLAWSKQAMVSDVVRFVDAGTPLLAEQALAAKELLMAHGELGATKAEIEARIRTAGIAVCNKRLAAAQGQPYLTALAGAYCLHFSATPPVVPPLPHTLGHLEAVGSIVGLAPGDQGAIVGALDGAFRKSVWFDERSPKALRATFAGREAVSFNKHAVVQDKPWTERIPYTVMETVQVPYQEPYTVMEYWPMQVPYTSYEVRSYPCGGGRSCTSSYPVTHYRSELRPRPTTRYRTAWRTETRAVTKYREVPRVFQLRATEHTGTYLTDWTLNLDLGPGVTPMALRRAANETKTGLEHSVTFEPAGIRPSQPNLPTDAAWFATQLGELGRTYQNAGSEHYRLLYCQGSTFSAESAARCARAAAPGYPAGVTTALATVFGSETDALLGLER